MELTWRWFGPNDKITLPMLRQIGVEGIVTALHSIPNGEVWSSEAILQMKDYIESYGLKWSVVESLPVSEAIKYGGPERDGLIKNYKISLANLGKAGIKCVCYNFMPVIDWVRTDLEHPWEDGGSSLYFNHVEFAYFDIEILKREGAADSYPQSVLDEVAEYSKKMGGEDEQKNKERLIENIIVKTQGFVNGNITEEDQMPVNKFKALLSLYKGVTKDGLRENLRYFLSEIMPVCREYGVNMCIHPDDPPFPLLGLPRIITSRDDIEWFLQAVDDPHNGLTLCAGSLSASKDNCVVDIAKEFWHRTHFVHLRSTQVFENGDFIEASHLSGRANIQELIKIFEENAPSLPMRVDHGRTILSDEKMGYNPGYSFHGRMLALAQVQGMISMCNYLAADKI